MNKTNIEYADLTWNPVTGCLHDCPYCYAKQRVKRFQGYACNGEISTFNPHDGPAVLSEPLKTRDQFGKLRKAAFPFGFDPTFHKYRLGEPKKAKTPQKIFVGSMCDLFGNWVPDSWIEEVFESCLAAPRHTYIFLTKNPARYVELYQEGILLTGDNIWYGTSVTRQDEPFVHVEDDTINTYISIEPLLGEFGGSGKNALKDSGVKWVIIGAETGHRRKKVIPKPEWVCEIVEAAKKADIPVFMKDSLKPVMLKGVEQGIWKDGIYTDYPKNMINS